MVQPLQSQRDNNLSFALSGSQTASCLDVLQILVTVLAALQPCGLSEVCCSLQGKGFPDVATRLLVQLLWKSLGVPVLALVDADPHGIEIMCVYRFGSLVSILKHNLLSSNKRLNLFWRVWGRTRRTLVLRY
jgi:hypothetical protein